MLFFISGESNCIIWHHNLSCILLYLPISAKHSFASFPTSIVSNIFSSLYPFQMLPNPPSSGDVNWYSVLRPGMSTYLISQRVKESSGKVSGFMSGTLNLRFQRGFPAAPKSKIASRVLDLVAARLNVFSMPLQHPRAKELQATMWSFPLWVVGSNPFSVGNILLSYMRVQKIPPGSLQKQCLILR